MWTPDVYEGAPTPDAAFFASAPPVAAVALLVRVVIEAMGPATDASRQIITSMAPASTLRGGVAAPRPPHIKRLCSYPSLPHFGFTPTDLPTVPRAGLPPRC